MEKIYIENAKKTFLNPETNYFEGLSSQPFNTFLRLLGYIIPNKITPEELIVYLEFLIKDIKDGICRFQNSSVFKQEFENYRSESGNLEFWLTYFPNFMQTETPELFYNEFLRLFKKAFYQLDSEEEEIDYGYTEIEPDVIDISNKDKAEVLASLYNHSKPIGMGIVQYDPTPMTVEIARKILEKNGYKYNYLKGRTMKINLESDIIHVYGYNRDNDSPGLAQRAISKCKNIEEGKIQKKKAINNNHNF